jgi:hypothetical protein
MFVCFDLPVLSRGLIFAGFEKCPGTGRRKNHGQGRIRDIYNKGGMLLRVKKNSKEKRKRNLMISTRRSTNSK